MNKARLVSALGIFIALLPYLGFPNNWRKVIFVCVGLMLIYLGYYLHRLLQSHVPPAQDKKPRIVPTRIPRKVFKSEMPTSNIFPQSDHTVTTEETLSFSDFKKEE